jgi:Zn-dependent protease with chaperone function
MNAHYFDGVDARLHAVTLAVAGDRITIAGAGVHRQVAVAATRWSAPSTHAPAMLYLADGALCEVHGAARAALAMALGERIERPAWHHLRSLAAALVLATLVAVAALASLRLFPAVAAFAVQVVPARVDQRLGQSSLAYLLEEARLQPSRLPPTLTRQANDVLARVMPAHPRIPIRLRIADAPQIDINALALPDGTIVVTDQLIWSLTAAGTMELDGELALAGVLAHEIGHLEARDAVRGLIGGSLMQTLSAVLFGDFSDGIATSSARLVSLGYARSREASADAWAIHRMQQLHLPLTPLAQWSDNVEAWYARTENRQRALPVYFRSHPATAERSARLRAADAR